MHKEINFSPHANNVLDFVGRLDLSTPKGERVLISYIGMHFIITVGTKIFDTAINTTASYLLNTHQVGVNS